MPIKIVIAEDNRHLAESLITKIELHPDFVVKWWEPNGQKLLEHLQRDSRLDLVLMDINMPVLDGIAATAKLKQRYPQLRVIMSTVIDDEDHLLRAIVAGANGYLLKDEKPEMLHHSLRESMTGGAPMSAAMAHKALRLIRNEASAQMKTALPPVLSKRETEILEQLSTGLSYQQIADNLCISPHTVRKHIENIYSKLQVHNKVEAVQLAQKNRWI